MFYSIDVLSCKSGKTGLAIVWLAGTLGQKSQARRLLRKDYTNVDIVAACEYLLDPPEPMSLRLSSSLMIGMTRVYGQQCNFFYGDVSALWGRLGWDGGGGELERRKKVGQLDLPVEKAKKETITLANQFVEDATSLTNIVLFHLII